MDGLVFSTLFHPSFLVRHSVTQLCAHHDLILVTDRCQIVERGTQEELFALNGLYETQFKKGMVKLLAPPALLAPSPNPT